MTTDAVKRIVHRLIRQAESADPLRLAHEFGIRVIYRPLADLAAYHVKVRRVQVIVINDALEEWESRFAVAHELGHIFLHGEENVAFLRGIFVSPNIGRMEREANVFAVELLLPDDKAAQYPDRTPDAWSVATGIPRELIALKVFSRR